MNQDNTCAYCGKLISRKLEDKEDQTIYLVHVLGNVLKIIKFLFLEGIIQERVLKEDAKIYMNFQILFN